MTYDIHQLIALIPGENKETRNHLYINNADGTPRWIWPVDNKEPDFLRFYNISTFRSKIFVFVVQLVFKLHLQSLIFKKVSLNVPNKLGHQWALFTGTIGMQQKMVIYHHSGFSKIPVGLLAKSSLYHEKATLTSLKEKTFQFIHFPKSSDSFYLEYTQTAFDQKLDRMPAYTHLHANAVNEIFGQDHRSLILNEYKPFRELETALASLSYHDKMPRGLQAKLLKVYHQIDATMITQFGFAHGDFTQWNMYVSDDKLYVYDWEASKNSLPKGFDNFHFIIQQAILIDRKSWNEIYQSIIENLLESEFAVFRTKKELNHYLQLYLLYHISRSMTLYNQQERWHAQIYWMIDIWNAALDTQLVNTSQRQLFINSLFDHLKHLKYAGIKISDSHPNSWSEYSDIDLLIKRKDINCIIQFCHNYPLKSRVVATSKSFMKNIALYFHDGSFLGLDLILELKRKEIIFLDADTLLQNSIVNDFGIKILHPEDEARYIGWFYALNNALVPTKYKNLQLHLQKSTSKSDQWILQYFTGNNNAKKALQSIINMKSENSALRRFFNKLVYYYDSALSMMQFGGLIITFSGVDGAGKSTIIEKIKYKIEKNLRKEVIVLRHRPSIIPIISALKYGKEKAVAISVSKLPRTGKNDRLLSSLLRFGYYYTDYIIGQFYIYFKYVMRGKVVIYDRYYFDFINDGKRSNIQLPSSWVKLGYRFLLKPDLNYFLYADANMIISRKQELDINTIESLTVDYKNLFAAFSKTYDKGAYFSIKNEIMDDTLSILFKDIKTKIAQI